MLGWHRSPEQPLRCALDSRPAKQGGADVERRVEDCRQALFRLKRVGLKSPTSLRSPGVHSDSSSALCVLVRHKIRCCFSNDMNSLRSSPKVLGHWSSAVPCAPAYSLVSDSNWRWTRDVEPAREDGPDALSAQLMAQQPRCRARHDQWGATDMTRCVEGFKHAFFLLQKGQDQVTDTRALGWSPQQFIECLVPARKAQDPALFQ